MKNVGVGTVIMLLMTSFVTGAYVALVLSTNSWKPEGIMLACLIGVAMLWTGYFLKLFDDKNR